MNEQNKKKSLFNFLETLELTGITFIKDYIQFLFDGPILTTYTLPKIKTQNKIITSSDFGYCDILCNLIGEYIKFAFEDEENELISIIFETNVELILSFKEEDKNCAEAIMLQIETKGEWNVW